MNKAIIIKLLIAVTFVLFSITSHAQPLPPSQHGESDDQQTPIGSGLVILLTLGAAYGGKKAYDSRRK